jgi:hypothetical protein
MSTSELRRGPGWWMDLEGQWNPPEEWPESNPPLPGWVRDPDGSWCEPAISDADLEPPLYETDSVAAGLTGRPIPELKTPTTIPPLHSLNDEPNATLTYPGNIEHPRHRRVARATSSAVLSFSEATADLAVFDDDVRLRRRAITGALLAAVTASMLAAGLVLLLLLL